MNRPHNPRSISDELKCRVFTAQDCDCDDISEDVVVMSLDELEAIRLADLLDMHHERAAKFMEISRQTFGRILRTARQKAALALIDGRTLKIEGGVVKMTVNRLFVCYDCKHQWEVPHGSARPVRCPNCDSTNIHRHGSQRGAGGPGGRVAGRGGGRGRRAGRGIGPGGGRTGQP